MGLLQSGEIDAARSILAPLQTGGTPDPLMLSAQGVVEMYAGNYIAAESFFHKSLQADPQQLTALWGLSLCLLHRNRVFEATVYIDHAAVLAPHDVHIKALQAYVYMLLDRQTDAAAAGKAALDGGEKSPFLMATLAQIYRRMGYAHKALEFGSFAAKSFYGMDFLAQDHHVSLPLTMIIADNPQVLKKFIADPVTIPDIHVQRTNLELELPKTTNSPEHKKPFRIVSPQTGGTIRGMQTIQVTYSGTQEIKFVVFLADQVMRGMINELPYHFDWDADAAAPGEHQLIVRAYDYRGMKIEEDTITVTTVAGKLNNTTETSARAREIQNRLIDMTMPDPMPLSLFTQLGMWHRDVHEVPQALFAFEKAAAIDPSMEGVLPALADLYSEIGMHSISSSGDVYHGAPTGPKRIALTFDDGPNPLYTPSILGELKKYDAHATFFLVGKMAQQYPDLVLQLLSEGHELANHSYTHPNMTKLTRQEIIAEVLRNRAVIKEITGQETYLFRPPGGDVDPIVTVQLHSLDYNIVYWNINAGEYRKHPPQEQASIIISKVRPGSILLLHNGLVDGTLNILPTLLAELNKRGYTFVTVSELFDAKPNGRPVERKK